MKTAFVLWSGGLDSTALIYNYLNNGYNVVAGYVKIGNNKDKSKQELNAIRSMLKDLYTHDNFLYSGILLELRITGSAILPQFPAWITALSYIQDSFDEVAIGYVMNDDAISFLEEMKQLWKTYHPFTYNKSKLVFPLSKFNKDSIKLLLPEHIINKTVSCEFPIFDKKIHKYVPCNKCNACIKRNSYLTVKSKQSPKLKLIKKRK